MNVVKIIDESIKTQEKLKKQQKDIEKIAYIIIESIEKGKKLLLCGNGGSAADAQHIACEICNKLQKERKSLPAIALTTNVALITAIANDTSFDYIFAKQIEGLGEEGDVLIAMSTSGKSKNIIKAIKLANSMGIWTIALTGRNSNEIDAKMVIKVDSSNTQRIQESHLLIGHIICEIIENHFLQKDK